MKENRDIAAALLGIFVAIIIWITIISRNTNVYNPLAFQPFHIFHFELAEIINRGIRGNIIGNILLFMPVGILLPVVSIWFETWYRTVIGGLCLSALVETTQLLTSRGFFEIDDMILNSFGTVIGYGVYTIIKISTRIT